MDPLELPALPETSRAPWRVQRADTPPRRLFVYSTEGTVGMIFENARVPGWENAILAAEAPAMRDVLVAMLCAPNYPAFERAVDDGRAILKRLAENRS